MSADPTMLAALNDAARGLSLVARLQLVADRLRGRIVFTTSFGIEDQLLTEALAVGGIAAEFVTLDTGRLFPETYELWNETEQRYGIRIRAFTPSPDLLEPLVARIGINGFYASVENRKACCDARKVEPLGRALAGADVWITGLRASQSADRAAVPFAAHAAARDLVKINPLFDWSREQITDELRERAIPFSPLENKGFRSIGCQPCTRAIGPEEDERAGRWWWEQRDSLRECGLHVGPDGRLVRAAKPLEPVEAAP